MASITFSKLGSELWRDYTTAGMPGTGVWWPVKANIVTWTGEIETALTTVRDQTSYQLGAFGGTANVITAAATPALDSWTTGRRFIGTPSATNTANDPTINIDSKGAKTLTDAAGNNLKIGQHVAGREYQYYYDGTKVRGLNLGNELTLYKYLAADDSAGSNGTSAQPWFVTAGALTVPASTSYWVEGFLRLSRSAGTTSHTTSIVIGGTATFNLVDLFIEASTGDADVNGAGNNVGMHSAAAVVVKAASTSATEQILVRVSGIIRVNAGGTLIPQFQYSVAPGGTPTPKAGSYWRMTPIPDNAVAAVGAWA